MIRSFLFVSTACVLIISHAEGMTNHPHLVCPSEISPTMQLSLAKGDSNRLSLPPHHLMIPLDQGDYRSQCYSLDWELWQPVPSQCSGSVPTVCSPSERFEADVRFFVQDPVCRQCNKVDDQGQTPRTSRQPSLAPY